MSRSRLATATALTALVVVIGLAGCAVEPIVPDTPADPGPAPVGDPDPDTGQDAGDGVVAEPGPLHDWDDLEVEVDLHDGWRLRDCEGDAPLRCLHGPDGALRGVVELIRFPEHDGLQGAYDAEGAAAALDELVAEFDGWLVADRGEGCPGHVVSADAPAQVTVAGAPAVIRGHVLVSPEGEAVEGSLVTYIADGGDLVLISIMATAPGACSHVAELSELAPAELEALRTDLIALMVGGSIPQG